MLTNYLFTILYLIFAYALYRVLEKLSFKNYDNLIFVFLGVGFITRLIYSNMEGFETDINLFNYWASKTTEIGFREMYGNDFFLDYPPLYLYILWFLRVITSLFTDGAIPNILLKMPSIITDILLAYFIYKVAKKYTDGKWASFLSITFIFSPMVFYNSAIWGQVDSLFSLVCLLSIYYAMQDNEKLSAFWYAIALLVKPQALLVGPVLLYYMIAKKDFKKLVTAISIGLVTIYVISLPFAKSLNPIWLFHLYKNTFGGYQYFTVNAYNFYSLIELNWVELTDTFGGLINFFIIPLSMILSAYYFFTSKAKEKYFYTGFLLTITIFTFATMMHERYSFIAFAFLMLTLAVKKDIKLFILSLAIQISAQANVANVFNIYMQGKFPSKAEYHLISLLMVVACIYAISICFKSKPINTDKFKPVYVLIAIIAFSSIITFYRLGNTVQPQTFYQSSEAGEYFDIQLDEVTDISSIMVFSGMGDEFYPEVGVKKDCNFNISYYDGEEFIDIANTSDRYVFQWKSYPVNASTYYFRITASDKNQVINEIGILDTENNFAPYNVITDIDGYFQPIFVSDEQNTLAKDESYYSSMFFDEIYHGRTAFEFIKGYTVYETTHPPIGKIISSIGLMIFGVSMFGFRVMGALAGILIIPAIYFLAKELFKNEKLALISAFLSAFDCMRYAQSRIATVDIFLVLFIILTFLFMFKYRNTYNNINLLFSGIFMGLAVGVKWNGAYAMVGLAIVFFITLYNKYKNDKDEKYVVSTITQCFIFFVAIPFLIYFVSFIPAINATSIADYTTQFFRYQINMYDYHSKLEAEHFFASMWYTWTFNIQPIWYAVHTLPSGLTSSITSMGNVVTWFLMPFAIVLCVYKSFKKDNTALIIAISYITALLPWVLVTRLCFIYHYFPVTIFGILAVTYFINCLYKSGKISKNVILVYLAITFMIFIIFLPVTSGVPIKNEYLVSLEWLDSWYFS